MRNWGKLRKRVLELRKRGRSYEQIGKLLGLGKSTVWYLVNDPEFLLTKKKRLKEYREEQGYEEPEYFEREDTSRKIEEEEVERVVEEKLQSLAGRIQARVEEQKVRQEELFEVMEKMQEERRKRDALLEVFKLQILKNIMESGGEREEKREEINLNLLLAIVLMRNAKRPEDFLVIKSFLS